MTTVNESDIPQYFIDEVKTQGELWGLLCDDEWVICDSQDGEDIDVLPLWSSEEAAQALCTDEWADYEPVSITLDEFFDDWVNDLDADGVRIGLDWDEELNGPEVEVMALGQKLAVFE